MNSRHKLRELAMTSLYQHFLLQKDIKQCVYDNCETNEIDPFLYTVTIDAVAYRDVYIDKINEALRQDWTFDRLGLSSRRFCLWPPVSLTWKRRQRLSLSMKQSHLRKNTVTMKHIV